MENKKNEVRISIKFNMNDPIQKNCITFMRKCGYKNAQCISLILQNFLEDKNFDNFEKIYPSTISLSLKGIDPSFQNLSVEQLLSIHPEYIKMFLGKDKEYQSNETKSSKTINIVDSSLSSPSPVQQINIENEKEIFKEDSLIDCISDEDQKKMANVLSMF